MTIWQQNEFVATLGPNVCRCRFGVLLLSFGCLPVCAQDPPDAEAAIIPAIADFQTWNWHAQNTAVLQGDPAFPAIYSGPQSLINRGEIQETVTFDLIAGARLWPGAEAHADFLTWWGHGLSKTLGIEAFPNGDAYKAGAGTPNYTFARLFVRQTVGLGGDKEIVPEDALTLAGQRDVSRLTFTLGRFTPLDICDQNTYAHDPHTQFFNWAAMANLAWDYGQDTVGYTTGLAIELNQNDWAIRGGFFQMPRDKNGFTGDDQVFMWPRRGAFGPFLTSWGSMIEFEKRYHIGLHPGALRFLAWLDEANFASYNAATEILVANGPGTDISSARAHRLKAGLGFNWEQELARGLGTFARLGWNDGHSETWTFTDVNRTASVGISINGTQWQRPGDTVGFAVVVSGISQTNQRFLESGGTDILDGDGALRYGWEQVLETYYDFRIWNGVHGALDYQFVANPAFNRDRGPVSVFGARIHWEY